MSDEATWLRVLVYGWATFALYLTTAIVSHVSAGSESYYKPVTSAITNQVSQDWSRQPYVDVKVFNNTQDQQGCPPEYPETVMYRTFYGSDMGCNCLNVFSYWITDEDTMIRGKECTYNQTKYGCEQAAAAPAIVLDTFRGRSICGKTGGVPFLLVERPDIQTGKCKDGFKPCSKFTSPDNTICYDANMDPAEVCPITKFDFSTSADKNALSINEDALVVTQNFEDGVYLHYTKDADSLPASSIQVESQMCTDPQYQVQKAAHELELQNHFSCPQDPHSRTQISDVYSKVGDAFQINEYDVQYENMAGLFIRGIPGYDQYYNNEVAEIEHILSPWSRPTFPWSLECEQTMTRQRADELIFSKKFSTHKTSITGIKGLCNGIYWGVGFFSLLGFLLIGFSLGVTDQEYEAGTIIMIFGHIGNRIIMYCITPFLVVRLKRIMDQSNAMQQGFDSLAEHQIKCGHPQTRIDVRMTEVQIKEFCGRVKAAYVLVWIVIAKLAVELPMLACVPLLLECDRVILETDNIDATWFDLVPFLKLYLTFN